MGSGVIPTGKAMVTEIHMVETPDSLTKSALNDWLQDSYSIPSTAQHMLIRRCFHSTKEGASYQANPVEVTLLDHGGTMLDDHELCYFPAYVVAEWITKNCTMAQRKKHLLSSLAQPMPALSQGFYDYTPHK